MRKLLFAFVLTIGVIGILLSSLFSASAQIIHRPNLRIDDNNYVSSNWAGYADQNGPYTSASGSWTVPAVAATTTGYSSVWIGVDGFTGSNNVIQVGTEQDCLSSGTTAGEMRYHGFDNFVVDSSVNGKSGGGSKSTSCTPTYYAWWEMYPMNAEKQLGSSYPVSPGDVITASVAYVSTSSQGYQTWTLTISDSNSNGIKWTWSQQETTNFVPDQSSAELIVERPCVGTLFSCRLTNLANFGTVTFNNAVHVDTNNPITMVNKLGQVLAQPQPATFSVVWKKSS